MSVLETKVAVDWAKENYKKVKNDDCSSGISKDAAYEVYQTALAKHEKECRDFIYT